MESNQLKLSGVDSTIWWGGLTANLTLTNHGDQPLSDWTYTFLTHHKIQDEAWGLQVIDQSDAGNGLSRVTIQGHDYGRRIDPGDSITIGIANIDAKCKSECGTYCRAIGCTISIANSCAYYDADRCILYEQCEGW